GGDTVTIIGSNFTGATAVNFGSTPADFFDVINDSTIVASSPALAPGTVHVTVTTYSGTSSISSADQFTASAPSAPAITSLGTPSGSTGGGTTILINGSGFTAATEVDFGFTPVFDFTVLSDSLLQVVTPPGSAGFWDVTVTTPAGTSALS